jgi:hypothetical protein
MFPKTFIDKVECLQSLMGVRTQCAVDAQYPFWIEDIEGIDVTKLGGMAKGSNPSGKDFANQLINNGARQMLADIETLINSGFKLNNIVGDMCSSCSLLPNYSTNAGIVVKPAVATKFGIMRISKLIVLANVSGVKQIKIDDGLSPRYFSVTLVAGVEMPVEIPNYSTMQGSVKISFTDTTIPVGTVLCATSSSCGCGGSKTSNNPINIVGLKNGTETTTQYGFLPCVALDCSYESLVCNLIKQTPNIFGLALLYKVGELYYDNKKVSDRNNDAIAFNDDEGGEQKKNYARLYWAKVKGTSGVAGLNKIISDYLRTKRADKCIVCEAMVKAGSVTG